jgi:hypothetical protein
MARQTEFKNPQNVKVKTPEGAGLFGDDEVKHVEAVEWLDLPHPPAAGYHGEFPYDSRPVLLTSDGVDSHEAYWRTTRAYERGRWVRDSFWAKRNCGGQKVEFEPLGYRDLVE